MLRRTHAGKQIIAICRRVFCNVATIIIQRVDHEDDNNNQTA